MKKLIIFLITLCVCAFAKAQLSDSIVRHYVVAIDGACPFYSDVLHSTYAKNKVEQTLKKMTIYPLLLTNWICQIQILIHLPGVPTIITMKKFIGEQSMSAILIS